MMNFLWHDVLSDPDEYVKEILDGFFMDVPDGDDRVFKGIQPRSTDRLSSIVTSTFPQYSVEMNFVRKSPLNQEEPNFIHSDEMHGHKTLILYLNKEYPEGYGTTLDDDNDEPILIHKARYNSVFMFDSNVRHSRNIKENFGYGEGSRLVQVMFLKFKG